VKDYYSVQVKERELCMNIRQSRRRYNEGFACRSGRRCYCNTMVDPLEVRAGRAILKTTHQFVLTDEYIADAQRLMIAQNKMLKFLYQTWWMWWLPCVVVAGVITDNLKRSVPTNRHVRCRNSRTASYGSFARRRMRAARNQADSRDIENRFRNSVQSQVLLDQ
jgi:hypothetical protein